MPLQDTAMTGREVAPLLVLESAGLCESLSHMQHEAALIINETGALVGLVTDGDVRRAFLNGASLDSPVQAVMTRQPFTVPAGTPPAAIRCLMVQQGIRHLPVVDERQRPIALHLLKDHLSDSADADAVIMAGGLGTRLRPLTLERPKPLLTVGDEPILDNILGNLKRRGVGQVVLTVNYLRDQIRTHVGDGAEHGLRVDYLEEEQQLGTAGSLAFLNPRPKDSFIVMNGDLLTDLDYRAFIRFHRQQSHAITVAVRQHMVDVPFGVVELEPGSDSVRDVVEKPSFAHLVNAGIYMLEPSVIDLVPSGEPYDMVRLIRAVLASGQSVGAFPVLEYWCDIGQHQQLAAARDHWRHQATTSANRAAALAAHG